MARINAGQDFGNAVAQPQEAIAAPRAAYGVTESAQAAGQGLERQAAQQANNDAQAQEQATRVDLQLRRQQIAAVDAKFSAEKQAREKADSAVAQSRLYVLRDKLSDGISAIDRGIQDGTISKADAPKMWAEQSKLLIDTDLKDVPEAHREIVRIDTAGLAERLTSKVGDSIRARDQSDTRAALDATIEHTQRLAVTDPQKARQILDASLDASGPAAGLNPAQIGKLKQQWVEGTSYTRAFTAVNAAKGSNKLLADVEKALAANTDIDPQKKAGMLAQIDGYRAANDTRALQAAHRAEIAAARVQRESDSAFTVLSGWAMAGKAANPEANAGLIAKLTPTAAQAYRAMAAEIPARTATAMLPIDQQQQRLDQLQAMRNTQGTSVGLEQEIKRTEEVLRQSKTDYGNDPLRAAQERGVLEKPIQPLDMGNLDALQTGLIERVQQAATVATRTRQPVSPLLPEEATRLGDVLNALPANQRAGRIGQLATVLPPAQMSALAKQMDGKNRALYLEMALGMTKTASGNSAAEWVGRGAQAIKDKAIKEDNGVMTGLRANIAKFIPDNINPQWREDAIDAARLIYLGQQASGGYSPSAQGAARVALGGEVIEWNGDRIPVLGGGMDEGEFRKRLNASAPAQIKAQAGETVYINGQPLPAADLLATLPNAKLIPVGPGKYGIDAGGSSVKSANRRSIILEIR